MNFVDFTAYLNLNFSIQKRTTTRGIFLPLKRTFGFNLNRFIGTPVISENKVILLFLFLATSIGCEKIPCYPPEYYAPEPNAPYKAEEVQVSTSQGHILAGTLTLPSGSVPPYPAVVLITGSSPQDRDHLQNKRKPVSYYKPFRQIADAISRKGIAVLRMDDQVHTARQNQVPILYLPFCWLLPMLQNLSWCPILG